VLTTESETEKTQSIKVNHIGTEVVQNFAENNSSILEHQGKTEKSINTILKQLDS